MSLLMLTWITCISGFLHCIPGFLHCTFWKSHLSRELRSTPWGGLSRQIIPKSYNKFVYCVLLIYLFIYLLNHLLMSVWTYRYPFYTLGYKPIVFYYSSYSSLGSNYFWVLYDYFLTSWPCKIFQAHLICSLPWS